MTPIIYYYFLDLPSEKKSWLEESLKNLVELMKHPPPEVDCLIGRLPEDKRGNISHILNGREFSLFSLLDAWVRIWPNSQRQIFDFDHNDIPRLLVCCKQTHPLAAKCLAENGFALWGVRQSNLAVVYNLDNPCAVWHEFLHLLGAHDCYDTENPSANRGPTCEHRQCIMQYAPEKGVVNGRLPLCSGNVSEIRKFFSKRS